MPIATPEIYAAMLDRAKTGAFAYPAINVSSSQTLNAALRGFAQAKSDGIVQVSTGGASYLSGVDDMAVGATALAEYAHVVAARYPVQIALHTDHCPKDRLDRYVRPLIRLSQERVARGQGPLFQSHMLDGSALPLRENLEIARELLADCAKAKIVLELEIGVVGGEEDGIVGAINEKLYSTPEDMLLTAEVLGTGALAATCSLPPSATCTASTSPAREAPPGHPQDGPGRRRWPSTARPGRFDLVFHGGSGTPLEEIRETLDYGVIKMNIDTDTQYAFTRPIVDHMMKNYDGVLKIDGEIGDKKAYDPRTWGKAAEVGMTARVVTACEDLRSAGTTLGKS